MKLTFTKMQGLGNDFVVIDATKKPFPLTQKQIQTISNRKTGIGFDQLLVIEPAKSLDADFNYRIFNADGSEVGQCGNGARCIARFIEEKKLSASNKKEWLLETLNGLVKIKLASNHQIQVEFAAPKFEERDIPFKLQSDINFETTHSIKKYQIQLQQKPIHFYLANVGNPHAVIIEKNIASINIAPIGEYFNQHPAFPEGVNIGFMEIIDPQKVQLRVFERGTGETLACGSGACAAMVIGKAIHLLKDSVVVSQQGGDLTISWSGETAPISMQGPAEFVYEGEIDLKNSLR